MMAIYIRTEGPVFTGEAEAGIAAIGEEIRTAVADVAMTDLAAAFAGSFQHPTGHYESQIQTDTSVRETTTVWDGGVIYGPWLEGTSRRNETTRFKGYRSFRKVTQGLNRGKAAAIATQILAYRMGRLT